MKRFFMAALSALAVAVAGAVALDLAFPPVLDKLADLSPTVQDRQGHPLRIFTNTAKSWRLPATVEDVDPRLIALLVAYEDRRFFTHPGVDPLAIARAAAQNLMAGRVRSGASTLTMQVVRLLEPRPRHLGSKIVEAARALQLEAHFSKREILGFYLTLAPFGGNLEGVRAATQSYFGKEPAELSFGEAALLVALPRSPTRHRPDRAPERARAARALVLARAGGEGALDPARIAEAAAEPIPERRHVMPAHAAHLAQTLKSQSPGATVIGTTLDGSLQRALEDLAARVGGDLHERASLAVLIVDNDSREVRAALGGLDWGDERRGGFLDLTRRPRSPGSTLKPFIYGLGFDDGIIHPLTRVDDVSTRFGDYAPRNFDRGFNGELTITEALQRSLNVPAVLVLSKIGPLRFADTLRRGGARVRLPPGTLEPGLPVALGGAALSLWEMTTLYTALARDGLAGPLIVRSGKSPAGETRLIGAPAARQVRRILEGAAPPAGFVQAGEVSRRGAIALKTGTSYGFRDAWAFGIGERATVGVWVGRPDGTPSPGRIGRDTAAPILARVFDLLAPGTEDGAGAPTDPGPPPELLRRLDARDDLAPPPGQERVRLVFPTPEMVVEVLSGEDAPLTLVAKGGRRPLSWLIDGRPLAVTAIHRQLDWRPEGPGFVRITVVDADGRSDSALVEIR